MIIISSPINTHPLTSPSSSFTLQWYVSTRSLATGRWPSPAANISGVRPSWGLGGTWSIQYTANDLYNTINVGVLLSNAVNWLMWEHMSIKWECHVCNVRLCSLSSIVWHGILNRFQYIQRGWVNLCIIVVTQVSVHRVQITSCCSLIHTFLLAVNQFLGWCPSRGHADDHREQYLQFQGMLLALNALDRFIYWTKRSSIR